MNLAARAAGSICCQVSTPQTGIKIDGKNINNFRYADDTTLMAESEEELKKPHDESESGE